VALAWLGIAHALLNGSHVALGAGLAAIILLPAAKTFLPKPRLAPDMLMH
jgi:hypothetical protein